MKWSMMIPAGISALYCIAAGVVCYNERSSTGGGGFISLRSMGAWLVTLPGSLLFDPVLGNFNVDNNLHVGASMLITAAILFGIVYGVLKIFRGAVSSLFQKK